MEFYDLATISPEDADQAKAAARVLASLPARSKGKSAAPMKVTVGARGDKSVSVTVPVEAFQLFVAALTQMAMGNSVTLVPHGAELTTQQAADFLNVSRPYLIGLLEAGKLAHRKVGTHRRIEMGKLLEFKRAEDERNRKGLDELTAEAQRLKLDY